MGQVMGPRHGSMQFWPRKRAKREYPRLRTWCKSKDTKILGFAGYKAGMTHIMYTDSLPTSETKNQSVSVPVTVVECPPMRVFSVRFYKIVDGKYKVLGEVISEKLNKELDKKIAMPKKRNNKFDDFKVYDDLKLAAYTQPKLTGLPKKKPEMFEICIGGSKEDKLKFAKEKLDKELTVEEVFKNGEVIDAHAVTKGKGFQGPVKRFGVPLRSHKSEKTRRGPGSLGAWKAQGHMMYRVAHAGQMGYHTRTEYNKWVMKVDNNPKSVNQSGGFKRFGEVRNSYLLIKGSVAGAAKRVVLMTPAKRNNKKHGGEVKITYVSQSSPQAR